jgi:hypothetical protein
MVSLKNYLNGRDPTTVKWNKAQSWIYTKGLEYAKISSGVEELLVWLMNNDYEVTVHSHKSKFTPKTSGRIDLRSPMSDWFQDSQLSKYIDFSKNVHFYEKKDDKVRGISEFELKVFVDDLIDIFLHPMYPRSIKSILFSESDPGVEWLYWSQDFIEILQEIKNDFAR